MFCCDTRHARRSVGRFDASALHIAHALKQTEIQKSYNKAREKPIDEYLVRLCDSYCASAATAI